jgi:hypothetical protein
MSQFLEKLQKYDVDVKNIYNVDEKGFLIGLSRTQKRVVSLDSLKSKRIAGVSQDGNREFITLIAAICADGTSLSPALIYAGESEHLQDTWLDGFDTTAHSAFFACSKNGWSDEKLGLNWLQDVFDRLTKSKTSTRDRRLLLVDGHNSHVNMPFIEYAHANRIVLAVLPPHSTHRLQPLDIGMFSPLATYYSQAIDRLLAESQGLTRLTKRDFWSLFHEAWQKAFHARNVRSAWEAAGLYPHNPQRVISTLVRPVAQPIKQETPQKLVKIPRSLRSIRRFGRRLQDEGKLGQDAKVLLHASEQLATKLEISQHEVIGLRKAVIHERKKRKRGKALKLLEEGENPSQARFFSPEKVARIRTQNAAIEQEEHQREQAKQDKKLQGAIARAEKAREAQEKKEARQLARQAAREQVAREKQEILAIREAKKAEKAAEAAKRKRDAEEKRAKRLQAKEANEKTVSRRKRPIEGDQVHRPAKRLRSESSPTRNAGETHDTSSLRDCIVVQPPPPRNSHKEASSEAVRSKVEATARSMRVARSGRALHLPMRYK